MGRIGLSAPHAPARRRLSTPARHTRPAGKALRMGCCHGPAPGPTVRFAPCASAGSVTTISDFGNATDPANGSDTRLSIDDAAIRSNARHASVTRISSPHSTAANLADSRRSTAPTRRRQTSDAAEYRPDRNTFDDPGPVHTRAPCSTALQPNANSHSYREQAGAGSGHASCTTSGSSQS